MLVHITLCDNIRQWKLAPNNVNVMTSLREQYASIARALRNMSQGCRHLLVCLERRMITSKNCATHFLMESCLIIPAKWRCLNFRPCTARSSPNIIILVHSVGSIPNILTAAAGNGAATRSPFCLQSLPPDIQRYQHDDWAWLGTVTNRRRAFRMFLFYNMHSVLVAIHPTLYLKPRQYHTSHK